jgi:hypothetical protein
MRALRARRVARGRCPYCGGVPDREGERAAGPRQPAASPRDVTSPRRQSAESPTQGIRSARPVVDAENCEHGPRRFCRHREGKCRWPVRKRQEAAPGDRS